MHQLAAFAEYIIIGVAMLTWAIIYVTILWGILKWKHNAPHPFNFDKNFFIELQKFGYLYIIGDIARLWIEGLIIGFSNAIVVRIITTILSVIKWWFFGWFRNFIISRFQKSDTNMSAWRKYIGDTMASFIFWTPIYIIQLFILHAYNLITMHQIYITMIVSIAITFSFGRMTCFFADLFEKYILRRKLSHTYANPLWDSKFKTK